MLSAVPSPSRPHPPDAAAPAGRCCPHCQGERVRRHGSFPLQDGTRQPRYLCLDCGRTFNQHTGTPLAYLKKRDRWPGLARCMALVLPVRQTAAELDVQVATAFRWRHRLLSALNQRPQPTLTGTVQVCHTFIRYSEKGSRCSGGPGARGKGWWGGRRFRRFIDGKPSCVLLAQGPAQPAAAAIVSRGRPEPEDLKRHLGPLLDPGAQVFSTGMAPYEEACRRLDIPHRNGWALEGEGDPGFRGRNVLGLQIELHGWLRRFHGVATRYLAHYLHWFLFADRASWLHLAAIGQRLLREANAILRPARAA